jgi:hypothetical protein
MFSRLWYFYTHLKQLKPLPCVYLQIIDAVPKQPSTTFLVLVMKRCGPAKLATALSDTSGC